MKISAIQKKIKRIVVLDTLSPYIFFYAIFFSTNTSAQFTPDFFPDTGGSQGTCVVHGNSSLCGQTPYREEVVYDPDTGLDYYHLLIGNPADGFAQDVYIERGFTSFPNGGVGSASGGGSTSGTDVFGAGNGTNTGNPTKVIVRQILNDGEIAQEYLKGTLSNKPKISQSIYAPDLSSLFVVDMSNSDYSDNTQAGSIVNTLTVIDPFLADINGLIDTSATIKHGVADFSMTSTGGATSTTAGGWEADAQDSTISAGRFTYSGGTGGTYTYLYDSYDPYSPNIPDFFDHTKDNPWSYTTNRPVQ